MRVVQRELTVRLELLSVETRDHRLRGRGYFSAVIRESCNRARERLD